MELYNPEEIARLNHLGDRLREGLRKALSNRGIAAQVTGTGSLIQVHITEYPVKTYRDSARASKSPLSPMHLSLLNCGIFTAPRGQRCLSTAMSEKEIDEAVTLFRDALSEMDGLALHGNDEQDTAPSGEVIGE